MVRWRSESGKIIGEGSPEKIASFKKSYIGKYLKIYCESSLTLLFYLLIE